MFNLEAGTVVPSAPHYGAFRHIPILDHEIASETITARFSSIAKAAARSVAVVQDGRSLTYADLDRRSNQLARLLQKRDVDVGSLVALHAGRSIASVVAILAILKAGAAYLPLDAAAPAAYLDAILKDCGPDVILCADPAILGQSTPALHLDAALAAAERESDLPLEEGASSADIAYIMFTSGSTGRPKGVMVPHRAVARLVIDQTYADFGPDEVFLHSAPLAFDASTFEIWGALLNGGRLVIAGNEHNSLQSIGEIIRRNGVTTAWFTAGLFHLLVDHHPEALRGLRQILAGGDVLSPTHILRAQAALPDCQFINGYGPTENTTFTCCYRIPREGWGGGPVPIGAPIRGTYVRLLDDDMNPVADGQIGMLYTGGIGLSSGYLADAERTTKQFVPDPELPGATLYCTGDLARRRPDGYFDFIGRRDRQVKIDGKRIELREIEEALRHTKGVVDALVTATRNGEGAPRLTGYIKAAPGIEALTTLESAARSSLKTALPAQMHPSQILVVHEFPLTANGKVDEARLPKAQPPRAVTTGITMNETERALVDIMSTVLGRPSIDVRTNFFDLGATSLKLMQAHAAIVRRWPTVDVVALFQHSSIEALARKIEGMKAPVESVAIRRGQQQAEALRRLRKPSPLQ